MTNRLLPPCLVLTLCATPWLSGCSDSSQATAPPPPASHVARMVAVARGRVDVEGGLLGIGASRDGAVVEVKPRVGDGVSAGELVVQLDARQAEVGVATAQAELDQALAQAHVLATRLAPLQVQARRLQAAAADGAATGQSADDALAAVAVLKAEMTTSQSGVGVARQHLAAARFERDQMGIRSPLAGRVVARNVEVGDRVTVQSGKDLLRVLPDRQRIVRADLGEAYVDTVRVGMRAEVIPDANPRSRMRAHVVRIGEVFGAAARTDDPQQSADARVVECVLVLDDGSLRIGQQVLVRILPP